MYDHMLSPPPFNFEYALYMCTSLAGWQLESGSPELFTENSPVVYTRPADKDEDAQRATFTLTGTQVSMDIAGRPKLANVDIEVCALLYGKVGNQPMSLPRGLAIDVLRIDAANSNCLICEMDRDGAGHNPQCDWPKLVTTAKAIIQAGY